MWVWESILFFMMCVHCFDAVLHWRLSFLEFLFKNLIDRLGVMDFTCVLATLGLDQFAAHSII